MRKGSRGQRAWNAFAAVVAFAVLLSALWMYARSGFGALAGISSGSMVVHMDFDVFWHSARALWEGRSLYFDTGGPDSSTNPPFWILLISPLGLLEPLVGYRVFVLITVLASVISLAWMASELRLRAGWAAVGMGMLLLSSPLLGTLALGQVYPLLSGPRGGVDRGPPGEVNALQHLSRSDRGRKAPARPRAPVTARATAMAHVRGAALAAGAAATLATIEVAGPGSFLDWVEYVGNRRPDGYWGNNTLPGAAARLFRENDFVEPIATLLWVEPAAYVLGIGIVILTAVKARRCSEAELWALIAASFLASPIA